MKSATPFWCFQFFDGLFCFNNFNFFQMIIF
jgi:hypothetical protein